MTLFLLLPYNHITDFMRFKITMKSDTDVNEKIVDSSQAGDKVSRSTIEFPYSDLDSAIELARGVHDTGGNECEGNQLAAILNMESKGGGFRLRIAGAKIFGLIETERGGTIRLSDLGKASLESGNDKQVRVTAFLNVPLYEKFYEEHKGSPLPPPPAISRAFLKYGVGSNLTDKARQVMMRSAKQAGFFELQGDRLTKPIIRNMAKTETEGKKDLNKYTGNSGGNGGGGDDLHPLIKGLFQTLPKSNTAWGIKDRMNWLVLANTTFNMLYTNDDDKEIKITINKIIDQ